MVVIIHILLAILFFLVVNQFGKHSIKFGYFHFSFDSNFEDKSPFFDILFKSFTPVLLTYISAYIFSYYNIEYLNESIYMIVVYYFVFRLTFIILIDRIRLTNWYKLTTIILVSLAMIYVIYSQFIITETYLLPTKQELATSMWLGIIAFIYKIFNELSVLRNNVNSKIDPYLKDYYSYFKSKYGYIIDAEVRNKTEKSLVYAILIYENFNRGKFIRFFEKIFFFTGMVKTTGIMQVHSSYYLSDTESVELGTQKILTKYRNELSENCADNEEHNNYSAIRNTIIDYNPDDNYYEQIEGIRESLNSI